jgi:hypothetical protein
MQFKKSVILIFILLLLVALYIFAIMNNNNTSCKNNIKTINSIPINHINVKKEDTFTCNVKENVKADIYNDDDSNVNNKIKITCRDNSLLQQFIKNDNVNNLQVIENMSTQDTDKQKEKEFQKSIRDDIEKDVSASLIKLKDISADVSIGIKTSVSIADTLINNDKYKGYNNYDSLRKDSYAPVTSIGKKLITPFASYPIAS